MFTAAVDRNYSGAIRISEGHYYLDDGENLRYVLFQKRCGRVSGDEQVKLLLFYHSCLNGSRPRGRNPCLVETDRLLRKAVPLMTVISDTEHVVQLAGLGTDLGRRLDGAFDRCAHRCVGFGSIDAGNPATLAISGKVMVFRPRNSVIDPAVAGLKRQN